MGKMKELFMQYQEEMRGQDEFIDDDDKQYMFRLDEKSVCDAYPTTEKFLQTSIEHNNNKPKDN